MRISTKGRYGLRALIDICLYASSDMVTVKSISERQGISERYLEQIFSSLRKGGIINAKKGALDISMLHSGIYHKSKSQLLQ